MIYRHALALLAVLSICGCSSIIEGRSQEIVVNTNPSDATCVLMRNDMPIGTVAPTPSAILIEKTKYDIIIKCNKDGYQEATYFNKSGAAGATFGNIVLGGGIGWAVDSATGSDNKYDSPVNITLVPEETAMRSHHKKHVAAKKPAAPAVEQQAQDTANSSDYPTDKNSGQ